MAPLASGVGIGRLASTAVSRSSSQRVDLDEHLPVFHGLAHLGQDGADDAPDGGRDLLCDAQHVDAAQGVPGWSRRDPRRGPAAGLK